MPRRIGQTGARPQRRRTFLKEWRRHRRLTLEQAASRFEMSDAQLSRIERGLSPYTQDFLELAAEAYATDVASLLIRDPTDPNAMWTIWEQAKPGQRQQIFEIAKTIIRTGS